MHPEIDWVSFLVRALWDLPLLLLVCAWVTVYLRRRTSPPSSASLISLGCTTAPCSCGRWWLDLLHAQACSNDAVAAVVLRRIPLGLRVISRRRRGRVRTLALDSEVAFRHGDICVGMPSAGIPVGCLDGLKLMPP
jgi:hypothetical protein